MIYGLFDHYTNKSPSQHQTHCFGDCSGCVCFNAMKKDIPSQDETFCQIALLFLMTQETEYCISSLIGTIYPEGNPSWEEIEKLEKNTLGQLINKLKERADMNDKFIRLLTVFLEGRNIFIHKLYRQEWFDTNTEEGRDAIWDFLVTYQKILWDVNHIASAAIFKHTESIGMPESEYQKKMKETGYLDLIKSYYTKADFAFKRRNQK